jgi:hypothetical protein
LCVYGGALVQDWLTFYIREWGSLYYWEREEIITTPGVLLFLLVSDALAKPSKLHPAENSIQLARIASLIIVMAIAVWMPYLECNWMINIWRAGLR